MDESDRWMVCGWDKMDGCGGMDVMECVDAR